MRVQIFLWHFSPFCVWLWSWTAKTSFFIYFFYSFYSINYDVPTYRIFASVYKQWSRNLSTFTLSTVSKAFAFAVFFWHRTPTFCINSFIATFLLFVRILHFFVRNFAYKSLLLLSTTLFNTLYSFLVYTVSAPFTLFNFLYLDGKLIQPFMELICIWLIWFFLVEMIFCATKPRHYG